MSLEDVRGSGRLREAATAFAESGRDPRLRATQASFGLAWATEWILTVGVGIVAFRDGGAAAVGLVGLLRMAPSALVAPLAAPVADRVRRERILVMVSLIRAAALGGAALAVEAEEVPVVYALAVLATVAGTLYRPAHSALLPLLCNTPGQLARANAVRGMLDSLGTFAGPLAAAALLATQPVASVFVAAAVASACAALVLARLRYEPPPRELGPQPLRIVADAREGIGAIRADGDVRLMFWLAAAQTFMRGAFTVFVVVVALELLETGEPGVGVLTAAMGAGAVLGSLVAAALVGRRGLAVLFGLGVALWGLPLAVVGALPNEVLALGLMGCLGIGNALVDVGIFTVFARLMSEELLARTFGVLESVIALSVGLGAVITPAVIDLFGIRGALVVMGCLTPLLVGLALRRLSAIDESLARRDVDVELLRSVPMLAPLPLPAVEHLVRRMQLRSLPAGTVVFEQGERGERFYVLARGEVEVLQDGELIRRLGAGSWFGEIALLREVSRTATVLTAADTDLWVLERRHFAAAVQGFTRSRREADALLAQLMQRMPRE